MKIQIGRTGLSLALWLAASWGQAGAVSWSMEPVHALLGTAFAILPGEPGDHESKEELKEPDRSATALDHDSSPGWRPGHSRTVLKERAKQKATVTTTKEARAEARRHEKELRHKALLAKREHPSATSSRFFKDQERARQATEIGSPTYLDGGSGTWLEDKEDGTSPLTATSGGITFSRRDIIPLSGPYYLIPASLQHIQYRHHSENQEADNPSRFASTAVGDGGIEGLLASLLSHPPVEAFPPSVPGEAGAVSYSEGDIQILIYFLEGAGTVHAMAPHQADTVTHYVRVVTEWHDLGDGHTFWVKTAYPCLYTPTETSSHWPPSPPR